VDRRGDPRPAAQAVLRGDQAQHDGAAQAGGREDLKGLVEYVVSLAGTGEATDAALVARGKELWDKKLECSSCHEIEAGKDSTGPTLAGRGTAQWVARVITDSAQKDLFGDTAEMPKFAGKLAPPEIEALAKFVAERGGEPKKDEKAAAAH
jgi:mono/diheme cytochrome c family protein